HAEIILFTEIAVLLGKVFPQLPIDLGQLSTEVDGKCLSSYLGVLCEPHAELAPQTLGTSFGLLLNPKLALIVVHCRAGGPFPCLLSQEPRGLVHRSIPQLTGRYTHVADLAERHP